MAYTTLPLRLEAHRDALARLWAEGMSDARIAGVISDRLRWLYDEGPAGGAATVLCRDEGAGEIVGCASYFRRDVWVRPGAVPAGLLCDFAVDARHRVGGAAIALQRALVERASADGLAFLFGHPNERSLPIFKRVGYRVVGETTAWLKPLRVERGLQEVLGWRQATASLAALPLNAALRVFDRARSAGTPLPVRGEVLARPDGRVDALWRRARAQYHVIGEQSSDYLSWRYGRFATAEQQIFGAFRDAQLVALATYRLDGPKASVCDVFADHLESAAEPLLLALSDHLRSRGVEWLTLSYVGRGGFGAHLRSVGFVPRPARRPLVVHPLAIADPQRAQVLDPASWFMLEGELDI